MSGMKVDPVTTAEARRRHAAGVARLHELFCYDPRYPIPAGNVRKMIDASSIAKGMNATAKRGKEARGGNKHLSWGPQGDG